MRACGVVLVGRTELKNKNTTNRVLLVGTCVGAARDRRSERENEKTDHKRRAILYVIPLYVRSTPLCCYSLCTARVLLV